VNHDKINALVAKAGEAAKPVPALPPSLIVDNPPFGQPGHVLQPGEVGYVAP